MHAEAQGFREKQLEDIPSFWPCYFCSLTILFIKRCGDRGDHQAKRGVGK